MNIESTNGLVAGQPLASHFIHEEQRWLERPHAWVGRDAGPGIVASRWSGLPQQPQDVTSEVDGDYHVVAIALKTATLTMFSARRLVHDGRMMSGAVTINHPAQTLRAIFHSAYDELHLHVPNALVAEYIETGPKQPGNDNYVLSNAPARSDPGVDQLAPAFVWGEDLSGPFGHNYSEGIALAIIARVLGRCLDRDSMAGGQGASSLPKWRLKRALEYIEAHLGDCIGLSEMAAATGLSRMHFAAQFRAATGMRPHEYLLRRRTEHAQTLLSTSGLPLVEIAFEVGFKSQSHFTAVFTRFAGETPGSWRQRTRTSVSLATSATHAFTA